MMVSEITIDSFTGNLFSTNLPSILFMHLSIDLLLHPTPGILFDLHNVLQLVPHFDYCLVKISSF